MVSVAPRLRSFLSLSLLVPVSVFVSGSVSVFRVSVSVSVGVGVPCWKINMNEMGMGSRWRGTRVF